MICSKCSGLPPALAEVCYSAILCLITCLALVGGCKRPGLVTAGAGISVQGPAGPLTVTASSSPAEVAEIVLAIVASGNRSELLKLMALEQIAGDVRKISGGRTAFRELEQRGPQLAAAAICSAIERIEVESRKISSESIEENHATVVVTGYSKNRPLDISLHFVREDSIWKIIPSRP